VVCMGGIGFTMSIFIDTLAFAGSAATIDSAKIAILVASTCAALLGYGVISAFELARRRMKKRMLKTSRSRSS